MSSVARILRFPKPLKPKLEPSMSAEQVDEVSDRFSKILELLGIGESNSYFGLFLGFLLFIHSSRVRKLDLSTLRVDEERSLLLECQYDIFFRCDRWLLEVIQKECPDASNYIDLMVVQFN